MKILHTEPIKKILIVHTWGIGDLIMLTPSIKILRENFPKAQIDIFVGQSVVGEVLKENHIVNEILTFNRTKSKLIDILKFVLRLRKKKYDLAFVSTGINPKLGSLFTFLVGAKTRVGEYRESKTFLYTHQVKADGNLHKVYSNLNLLRAIDLNIEKIPLPFFEFSETDKEFAKSFVKQIGEGKIIVGLHPGAGEKQPFKVWDKDNFINLGRRILEKYVDASLIIFGGPKERELCQEIKEKIESSSFCYDIRGRTFLATSFPLKQIAALIDSCQVFIGSDSGVSHIASTTKTNPIILIGPTMPERTGVVGKKGCIIQEKCNNQYNDITSLEYDTTKAHKCINRITPNRVFEEIKKII